MFIVDTSLYGGPIFPGPQVSNGWGAGGGGWGGGAAAVGNVSLLLFKCSAVKISNDSILCLIGIVM